jgi:hypothetical protein
MPTDRVRELKLRGSTVPADTGVRSKLPRLALPDFDWRTQLQRRKLSDDFWSGQLRRSQLSDDRRIQLRHCGMSNSAELADLPRTFGLPAADNPGLAHMSCGRMRHVVRGAQLPG